MLVLLTFNAGFVYGFTSSLQNENINESPIYKENSSYLMDRALIARGYSLKNENNNVVIQYKNENISMPQFYASSIGPDEAIKLYILLKDTIKKANIYLNNKLLMQKTDNNGAAVIDKFFKKGNFHIQLTDSEDRIALNYYFLLDENLKVSCSGIAQFKCQKENY